MELLYDDLPDDGLSKKSKMTHAMEAIKKPVTSAVPKKFPESFQILKFSLATLMPTVAVPIANDAGK